MRNPKPSAFVGPTWVGKGKCTTAREAGKNHSELRTANSEGGLGVTYPTPDLQGNEGKTEGIEGGNHREEMK